MPLRDPAARAAWQREYIQRPEVAARRKARRPAEQAEARARRKNEGREEREVRLAHQRAKDTRRYWARTPEAKAAKQAYIATWKRENREYIATRERARRVGVHPGRIDELRVLQSGRCAICDCVMLRNGRGPQSEHIDHDHRTGIVRGLLCSRCNLAIGALGDSVQSVQRALDYLRSPPGPKAPVLDREIALPKRNRPDWSPGMGKQAYLKAWRQANPDKIKAHQTRRRARRYGTSEAQLEYTRAAQGGCCAVCTTQLIVGRSGIGAVEHIDHCHVTGVFRGLLCATCNTAIGKLGDTALGVERALRYLSNGHA